VCIEYIHLSKKVGAEERSVVLHWQGAGWYAPCQQGGGVVHEYLVVSTASPAEVYDLARRADLGTPHWLGKPEEYGWTVA